MENRVPTAVGLYSGFMATVEQQYSSTARAHIFAAKLVWDREKIEEIENEWAG